MQLDPHVLAHLKAMQENGAPDMSKMSVEECRAAYRQQSELFGGPVREMARVVNTAAKGPRGEVPLRVYRPEGTPEKEAPALVYVHGGGWVIGDLDSHDKVCRQIAARAGCVVVSVDYALAPEHPAPAGADDVRTAVSWIFENAGALGLDRQRIGVGGDSAGGGLAAVAAIHCRNESLPLACQVLIYPGLDNRETAWAYPSRIENAQTPPLDRPMMDYFMAKVLPDKAIAGDWRISPITVTDSAGLAPALIISGSCDALHDENNLYAARLDHAGVPVVKRNFPGMIHGFIELAGVLPATIEALDLVATFLRERLAISPAG
ncbi:alpha/beta hydrolase [Jiella mangrovi]|uniref:Alpha/beta hydrolase n=1 Tax=Jiella mangrovi TaxID=2821407 RepID=A0ABS4BEP4_9HYPH|nr:alpha/beta hydrolase [Jiella mangrovi]MBP0615196.1 alpha/beta hydrolase [Jiella mangrovi]